MLGLALGTQTCSKRQSRFVCWCMCASWPITHQNSVLPGRAAPIFSLRIHCRYFPCYKTFLYMHMPYSKSFIHTCSILVSSFSSYLSSSHIWCGSSFTLYPGLFEKNLLFWSDFAHLHILLWFWTGEGTPWLLCAELMCFCKAVDTHPQEGHRKSCSVCQAQGTMSMTEHD